MASPQSIPQPDLFEHADITAAREAVAEWSDARDTAEKNVLRAPSGKVKERWAQFYRAAHQLLRAENRLAKLLREAGQ